MEGHRFERAAGYMGDAMPAVESSCAAALRASRGMPACASAAASSER